MISTQRLVVLFIMINVVVGIVDLTYYSPTAYQSTPFDSIVSELDDFQEEQEKVWGGLLSGASQVVETTIINPLRLGYTLLRFFWKAFIPFSVYPRTDYSTFENVGVTILTLFRTLLSLIVGFEAYAFYKNKKQT